MSECIIYARFSPRPNAAECEAIDYQIGSCREYAKKMRWKVVGEFANPDVSGDVVDRPELWMAVDMLKKGSILLVDRLDRLSRDTYLSFELDKIAAQKKARIVSVAGEGTWEDTAESHLIRDILKLLAAFEKKKIAARTKASMLMYQKQGRRMSKRVPYGWVENPDTPMHKSGNGHVGIIRNPAENEVIETVLLLRKEGVSLRGIANRLNKLGIPSRENAKWKHQTIDSIIKREQ